MSVASVGLDQIPQLYPTCRAELNDPIGREQEDRDGEGNGRAGCQGRGHRHAGSGSPGSGPRSAAGPVSPGGCRTPGRPAGHPVTGATHAAAGDSPVRPDHAGGCGRRPRDRGAGVGRVDEAGSGHQRETPNPPLESNKRSKHAGEGTDGRSVIATIRPADTTAATTRRSAAERRSLSNAARHPTADAGRSMPVDPQSPWCWLLAPVPISPDGQLAMWPGRSVVSPGGGVGGGQVGGHGVRAGAGRIAPGSGWRRAGSGPAASGCWCRSQRRGSGHCAVAGAGTSRRSGLGGRPAAGWLRRSRR
jgi:hypothetical protein